LSAFVTVTIPRARLDQLAKLSKVFGTSSNSATVERLIHDAMTGNGLPMRFESAEDIGVGVTPLPIHAERAVLMLFRDKQEGVALNLDEARNLAAALEYATEKGARRWEILMTERGRRRVAVSRRGRGGVVFEVNGAKLNFSPAMAQSLAWAIRDAATRALNMEDGELPPDTNPGEPATGRAATLLELIRFSNTGTIGVGRIRVPNAE
jgi:hypothetical protein